MRGRGGSDGVKELRKEINNYVLKAEEILEALIDPTKENFYDYFKVEMDLPISKANKKGVVFSFQEKISELTGEGRIGTANNCKSALTSFLKFRKELYFEDIDVK